MKRSSIKILLGIALLLSRPVIAQVVLSDNQTHYTIGRLVSLLDDQQHRYRTLADVQNPAISRQFVRSRQLVPNKGFSTADYWVRFDLDNRSHSAQAWLLEIAFGNLSIIDLYVVSRRTGAVIHKQGGDALGRKSREISYHTFVFYLPTVPDDDQTIYIRLSSTLGQALLPLYIWRQDAFIQSAQVSGVLWGLYYGFLLVVFLYHLAFWLFTRERNYGLISLYLGAYVFYELSRGYCLGVRFLWPGNIWLTHYAVSTFFTLTMSSFLWFYNSVLRLNQIAPRLQFILNGIIGLLIVGWILTLLSLPGVSQNLVTTAVGFVALLYLLFLATYSRYRGNRSAGYYWAAVMTILLAGIIHTLNRAGSLSDSSLMTQYALNIGSTVELILLSIGLADTVRLERRERDRQIKTELERAELRGLAEERGRLASEMHDGVGNSVLMLRQFIQQLRVETDQPQRFNTLDRLALEVYEQVRQVANNLLPAEFKQKGMNGALLELIGKLNQAGKTHFFLLMSGQETRLTGAVQYQLYLVLIELMNNIIKHAQATEASIRFVASETLLTITIRDNGVGVPASPDELAGRGWHHIRQRLDQIEGHCITIDRPMKEGLVVQLTIPMPGHI